MKALTPPPKRAGIYYRVSGKEQVQGYSLDAQVRAIEAYCETHGHAIVARYPEPGRSARKDDEAKRPAFQQMLADAEAGVLDIVVVHKMDRFARNRRIAFDAFHRLGKSGVGFVSIAENMDYSTPAGQLMLTMMVGMAQFYSDNLAWETKKGKAERKAQGLYNGLLPFGSTKGPDGHPIPDRAARWCLVSTRAEVIHADGLTLAFTLAAAGQTDREIARALNAAGYRTSGNRGTNPFSKDTVRVILSNRFYMGELPDGEGGWLPGKHDALIDPALFDQAQVSRAANTRHPRRVAGARIPWALSGIAVCGSCGRPLTLLGHASGRRRVRCAGRTQGNGCDEASCFVEVIEDQIGALLAAFNVPENDQTRLLAAWHHYRPKETDRAGERVRLHRKLDRLKELYLEGEIDRPTFQSQRSAVQDRIALLPSGQDQDDATGRRLADFLANVSRAWAVATPEERNKLARQLFGSVVISNSTAVAIVPRPDLLPFLSILPHSEVVTQGGKECYGGSDGIRTRDLSLDRAAC